MHNVTMFWPILCSPHQMWWGDQKLGTAISCTKYSQVAGLFHNCGSHIVLRILLSASTYFHTSVNLPILKFLILCWLSMYQLLTNRDVNRDVSKLSTNYSSFCGIPRVSTNCSPVVVIADFYSSLMFSEAISQTDSSIRAGNVDFSLKCYKNRS